MERWQVNPAIHHNEWANFQKGDFTPVVPAYRAGSQLSLYFEAYATCCRCLALEKNPSSLTGKML